MMSEPTTIREALEAAIEEPTASPVAEAPLAAPDPGLPAAPGTEPAAASLEAPAAGQDLDALAEGSGRERDELGRFKPRGADAPAAPLAEQPPAAEGIQPGPKAGPRPAGERAPQAWRPEVREHWGQLPEPVRAEIQRREVEVQRTLQESAEARRNYDAVMKTIAPYEAFIRAENSNPLQAIDNLMGTAARLRTGTAPELAQMMSGLIQQFGTGRFGQQFLEILDQTLAGQVPKADPQQAAIEQVLNQRLAPIQSMFQQFQQAQQAQQERVVTQAHSDVSQFLDQAEFGQDVREEMADLLEVAQRRGQAMTLQQAYQKACLLNDRVRTVLQGRQQAQGAQAQTQAAQRARSAAVSVTGAAPAGALRQQPTDVRSAIEAAIVQTAR
jgi:hypothetical protein